MTEQGPTGGATPHITIHDRRAAEAIDFYSRAFGAREARRTPSEDGRLLHASLAINEGWVMLNDAFPEYAGCEGSGSPAGFTIHLQVDDPDRWFERAVAAGATVRMPLADQFWGDRYGQIEDPYGYRWSIGAPVADKRD